MNSPVSQVIAQLHEKYADLKDGGLADYIPELANVDPNLFGIAIATRDGHLYEIGDTRHKFTIQSISKALTYGLALEDRGEEHVLAKIGVEPSGEAFNAISLKPDSGAPFNPLINAGAIATCGQILETEGAGRFERIRDYLSKCAGEHLEIDQEIYKSESATGHRNRAIGWMLRNFDIIEENPRNVVEAYFQQCSLKVTCADLAVMGATLANQGVNPITAERAIAHEYVDNVLAVMASCGMYDWSGEWIYRVGLPAKSGVGGGILAVLPGQLGVGVFSPPLDEQGNSVRGIKVCMELARSLDLHMFNPSASAQPALHRAYNGTQVRSKRRLPGRSYKKLRSYGDRIRVMELQGALLFSTFEPVVREIVKQSAYCKFIVLNLRNVFSMDSVALKMVTDLSEQLTKVGVELLCCEAEKLGRSRFSACFPEDLIFANEDAALEHCENALLAELMPDDPKNSLPVTLDQCGLLSACTEDELSYLDARMVTKKFSADETMIQTGTEADELFIILSGIAEVRLELPNRSFQRLDALSSGMCFGEVAFLDSAPRSAGVFAVTVVECRIIDQSLFTEIEDEMPRLKSKLLNEIAIQLADRLRQANTENSALRS